MTLNSPDSAHLGEAAMASLYVCIKYIISSGDVSDCYQSQERESGADYKHP